MKSIERIYKRKQPRVKQSVDKLTPVEKSLLFAEVKEKPRKLKARFKVFFVKLENGVAGIFKPKSLEHFCPPGIEKETYYQRERAAYLVDLFLGFDLVPTTVIRKINGEIGSFQQFIPDCVNPWWRLNESEDTKLYEDKLNKLERFKLCFLDYLIWNSDRSLANILVDKNNKIWAIDNSLCFGNTPLVIDEKIYSEIIPEEIREGIIIRDNSVKEKVVLRKHLGKLLPAKEVVAFFKRLKKLAEILRAKNKTSQIDQTGKLTFE